MTEECLFHTQGVAAASWLKPKLPIFGHSEGNLRARNPSSPIGGGALAAQSQTPYRVIPNPAACLWRMGVRDLLPRRGWEPNAQTGKARTPPIRHSLLATLSLGGRGFSPREIVSQVKEASASEVAALLSLQFSKYILCVVRSNEMPCNFNARTPKNPS
jgi:hypothetical protein